MLRDSTLRNADSTASGSAASSSDFLSRGSAPFGKEHPEYPERLGPYRIDGLLGQGGMGAVYRAWDERLGRWVAIKRLRPNSLVDEEARERFLREAKAVAQLSHSAIIPVFDLLQSGTGDWIVMEYVEGMALSEMVTEHLLSVDQVLVLGRDIAEGISAAHAKGIIHRDLKSENILVTPSGRARILDFGLARKITQEEGDTSLSRPGVLLGTARAMSPEQVCLQQADHRSDIFSLGILFYEALTSKNPFLGRRPMETLSNIVRERQLPAHHLNPEVPESVSQLVDRMLAKEPADRPQSAGEVVAALDAVSGRIVREIPAPAVTARPRSVLATLLCSELVGAGDDTSIERLHDQMVRDLLSKFEGREMSRQPLRLLQFERPSDAVRYSLDYHRAVGRLSDQTQNALAARLAIQLSEVGLRRSADADTAAIDLNLLGQDEDDASETEILARSLTAQLMRLASPGQTLLTRAAFDLARQSSVGSGSGSSVLSWMAHGHYLFDGFEDTLEIFEVGIEDESPLRAPEDNDHALRVVQEATIPGWRPARGLEIPQRTNWLLERKLASGGIGEVWLACHKKTGDRRVFKFCYEARSLNSLKREITVFRLLKEELGDRRDITRILDWNFDRAPYFIEMQHTASGSMLDWAEQQGGIERVPLHVRLNLVAQVAEALAAAHSVGVLHKDVKPSNVLIDLSDPEHPQAQLTDFGIGRIMDRDRLERAGITMIGFGEAVTEHQGFPVGTHLYMAPELLEGKPATLQSDIYALGVMLYQLLICDFSRALAPGWQREITNPVLVQTVLATIDGSPQRRMSSALDLAQRLRDLDNLEKQHLHAQQQEEHRRLQAREAEATRRELHQLRRRWRSAGIAALVLLVMTAIVFLQAQRTAKQSARADREAELVQQIAGVLVETFDLLDPYRTNDLRAIDAHQVLARASARIEQEFQDQPRAQAKLLDALGNVYLGIGDPEHAEPLIMKSLQLRQSELPANDLELAESLVSSGQLLVHQGRFAEAETSAREALEIRKEHLSGSHPMIAEALHLLAITLHEQSELLAAEQLFRQALQIRRDHFGRDALEVAESLNDLALLEEDLSQFKPAEELYREALEIRRKQLGPDHPEVGASLNNVAGVLYEQGEYAQAQEMYDAALATLRVALGESHPNVAMTLNNLAALHQMQHDYDAAEQPLREALAIYRQSYGEDHPQVATTLSNLAALLRRNGKLVQAEATYREVLAMRQRLLGENHPDVATTLNGLGLVHEAQGDLIGAEKLIRQALDIHRQALGMHHSKVGTTLVNLGRLLQLQNQLDEAEDVLRQALEAFLESLPPDHWRTLDTETQLGACLLAQERFAEAEPLLLHSYEQLAQQTGDSDYTRAARRHLDELYDRWQRPAPSRLRNLDRTAAAGTD